MDMKRRSFLKIMAAAPAITVVGLNDKKEKGAVVKLKRNQIPKYGKDEKYYLVKFDCKRDSSEPDDVALSVNGETMIMNRNVWMPLPERFIELAGWARVGGEFSNPKGKSKSPHLFPHELGKKVSRRYFENYMMGQYSVVKNSFDQV